MSRIFQALLSRSHRLSTSISSRRRSATFSLLTLLGLIVLAPVSYAGSGHSPVLEPGILPTAKVVLPVSGQRYELHLYHLHTHEHLDVIYRIGDTYIPAALDKLNYFLRDDRTQTVKDYDPREFDVLHNLLARLGRPNALIDVVCGYRTPWLNNYLRTRGPNTGVAEHSQHMQAKAIDIRVPGVSTHRLDQAALSLHEGGVGYYPVSHFVHVDVGPVREWSFSGGHSRHHRHRRS